MKWSRTLALCAAVWCFCLSPMAAGLYERRPEAQAYIERLVREHQLDRRLLMQIFSQTEKQKYAIQAMDSPAEKKPWREYRKLFVMPSHVRQGLDFYEKHSSLLEKIEHAYQVPAEVIVAITGIETRYGTNTGNFPVFDTLITLSFDYPRRAPFFLKQLTEMFLLLRDEQLDWRKLKGSYAGALGIGQFMPGSYRHYAVDFDQDGHRDLWGSMPDALASIASYLHRHGWKRGARIANRLPEQMASDALPFNKQTKPWLTLAEFEHLRPAVDTEQPQFSLFSYLGKNDTNEYWLTYYNFYAISRYNHSALYTMAVYQLSEEIKEHWARRTSVDARMRPVTASD